MGKFPVSPLSKKERDRREKIETHLRMYHGNFFLTAIVADCVRWPADKEARLSSPESIGGSVVVAGKSLHRAIPMKFDPRSAELLLAAYCSCNNEVLIRHLTVPEKYDERATRVEMVIRNQTSRIES